MSEMFEKSIRTLELPRVLELLSQQAISPEAKERCRAARPETETEEVLMERVSLRQAIEKLPEKEGMVIKLRFFHGLTQERVSKVLQVSQVQVSRIEKRALVKLREMMDPNP